MNRIDRLYALVEELRAAGPRGRTARQLADHFELSVRTIERDLSAEIAEVIWRAVRDNQVLRVRYIDVGGVETERVVEPQHVVVGPNGSYLTAWCHLREEDRVFRMDRITCAEPAPSLPRPARIAVEPVVDGHETKLPESALRLEDPPPKSDIGLSRARETVGVSR